MFFLEGSLLNIISQHWVQIHPIVYIQVCLSHVPTILQVELASISEPYELVGAVKSPNCCTLHAIVLTNNLFKST